MPELPDAIAKWGYLDTLLVESSNITHLPAALTELQVFQLMFKGNAIQAISDTLLANQALAVVYLQDNPLQALPATIGSFANSDYLVFERTNVTEVPDWFQSFVEQLRGNVADYLVSGFGSPFCDSIVAAVANDPTSLTAFEQSLVSDVCSLAKKTSGAYPIELIDPQRVP